MPDFTQQEEQSTASSAWNAMGLFILDSTRVDCRSTIVLLYDHAYFEGIKYFRLLLTVVAAFMEESLWNMMVLSVIRHRLCPDRFIHSIPSWLFLSTRHETESREREMETYPRITSALRPEKGERGGEHTGRDTERTRASGY